MKYFDQEIKKFYDKLKSGEKFAFSKYADGEWMAMKEERGAPGNGEWVISEATENSSQKLRESFLFKDPGYFVGISCPCCQGDNHFQMRVTSQQDESQITFANLFVNSNYPFFLENFVPEFSTHSIVLVANRNSKVENLPFKLDAFYGVGYNAWVDDIDLVENLIDCEYKNKLFLFSCGPLGNILAANLWKANKNNTYIDVGSTLDKYLHNDSKNKRLYAHEGTVYSGRTCVWGNLIMNNGVKSWEGILR